MLDFYGVNIVTLACTSLICAGAVVAGEMHRFAISIGSNSDQIRLQPSPPTLESGACWSEVM
jgi:hypothetical protein